MVAICSPPSPRWLLASRRNSRFTGKAAYGANFARLADIKHPYDLDNVFHSNQNIAPVAYVPPARPLNGQYSP